METILTQWRDKSEIYFVLHSESSNYYRKADYKLSIPAIIITSMSAALAFSIQAFPKEINLYIPVLVGILNLTAGTFTTVSSYKKLNILSTEHFTTAVKYSKLYRKISEKMIVSKHISKEFLSEVRISFDELIEKGPIIPNTIIRQFKKNNKNIMKTYELPNIIKLGGILDERDNSDNESPINRKKYLKRVNSLCFRKAKSIKLTSLIEPAEEKTDIKIEK